MKLRATITVLTATSALLLATASHAQTPPTVLSAVAVLDYGGANGAEPTNQYVDVTFSQDMDVASVLDTAHYSISGATITNVSLFTNNLGVGISTMAILQLAAPLNTSFTLKLTNVVSASSVPVSNPSVGGTIEPLHSIDIGGVGNPIFVPGTTFSRGQSGYVVNASGADIYGLQDSFRFIYEPKTNNFDVVVRVVSLLAADQWTKAGLQVREIIDPDNGGSRMITMACTPASTNATLDGSGPINDITGAWRDAPDSPAYNANNANGSSYFIGEGTLIPNYPNQWLRMTRKLTTTNDVITCLASIDGTNWTVYQKWDPQHSDNNGGAAPFPSVCYVGIAQTAHISPFGGTPDYLATATYANYGDYVAPTNLPAPPPFPGYPGCIRNEYNLGGTNSLIVLQAVDYCLASPSADGTHNWVFTTTPDTNNFDPSNTDTNFSGAGVMEAQPNMGQNCGSVGIVGAKLTYTVNFTNTGTYHLWMRGIGDGPAPGVNDTVLIGLDGNKTGGLGNGSSFPVGAGFSWAGAANVIGFPVSPYQPVSSADLVITNIGLHVINVWMREDGFDFDKLVITSSSDYTPTGVGPPVSPLVTANLAISRSRIITWSAGAALQFAAQLTGPWADVAGATSPYTATAPGFYRIREN